jgi:transcriptional regulator with XRE-family HTH domain
MTGKEAKKTRLSLGFTQSEIATFFGYNHKQAIQRLESREEITKHYKAALTLLVQLNKSTNRTLDLFLKDTTTQDAFIVHKRKRPVKVLFKSEGKAQELAKILNTNYSQTDTMKYFCVKIEY